MSKTTATQARKFVTAFRATDKPSVAMVNACVAILADGTTPAALVAAVRGAYESIVGTFDTTADSKNFERLVSQRSFAAQLVRIVGDDAATDETAIRAALSVSSGQLPRKTATDTAKAFEGTNDGPGFAAAIKKAKASKAPRSNTPEQTGAALETKTETAPVVIRDIAPEDVAWKTALKAIDLALANESDPKAHAKMVTALKATLLRHSMTAVPASTTVKA